MPLRQRKSGLVSLEREAESIAHPFLEESDGVGSGWNGHPGIAEHAGAPDRGPGSHAYAEAKVFESAGGYAPLSALLVR